MPEKVAPQKSWEFTLTSVVRTAVNAPFAIARRENGTIVIRTGSVKLTEREEAKVNDAIDTALISAGIRDPPPVIILAMAPL